MSNAPSAGAPRTTTPHMLSTRPRMCAGTPVWISVCVHTPSTAIEHPHTAMAQAATQMLLAAVNSATEAADATPA